MDVIQLVNNTTITKLQYLLKSLLTRIVCLQLSELCSWHDTKQVSFTYVAYSLTSDLSFINLKEKKYNLPSI